ncbi:MAG: hypothetical protein FWB84_03535 [Candidatus Bathyarchaeota archaeon]|uniref:hypothetical protein n=1 Tax=Candidatus Bathycorpusculum sp. TaxID=2994959 RepID=UPI0028382548|nr:hypothetical protein [Candidatus Termiticorpusculum sp.]MCL2257654.1 hypothetical protein [Candidatus Termiticorpusculum sp.]MCL2291819.1 hypothetical protein [Candidatus Termiticorpusculum sp.]
MVEDADTLIAAIDEAPSGTLFTIVLNKDIALEKMLTIPANKYITLTSNSDPIFFKLVGPDGTITNPVSTITVNSGGVLTLGGIIVTHNTGFFGEGITVNSGGEFIMSDGEISGNTGGSGGGVSSSGSFLMSGGKITNNEAGFGGGVHIAQGSFTMKGGMISYNKATFFGTGGGVDVGYHCYFSLSGGEISYNTAEYYGGGVNNNGDFRMTGGKITNNKVTDSRSAGGGVYNRNNFVLSGGTIAQNIALSGGGVLTGSDNDFTMSGGEISSNTATNGGGVYIEYGTFKLTSGKISSNAATNSGGGVWIRIDQLDQLFVSNGVVFSNNRASEAYERSSEHDAVYAKQIGSSVTWTTPFTQGYNNYDIGYTSNTPMPDITPSSTPPDRSPNRTPFTVSPSAPDSNDNSSEGLDFRIVVVVTGLVVALLITLLVIYFKKNHTSITRIQTLKRQTRLSKTTHNHKHPQKTSHR